MRKQFRGQMDLFTLPARPVELTGTERQKAVVLLQALLTEAMTTPTGDLAVNGIKETGDE